MIKHLVFVGCNNPGGLGEAGEDIPFNRLPQPLHVGILGQGVVTEMVRLLLVPVVILCALPLAVIGALVVLAVTGHALDLPALIGLLMLTGIVVTKAIVLLDLV
jgi:HAE1 family hydrophobic/amphiphilic exporter-1